VTKLDTPDILQTPGKGRGYGGGIKTEKKSEDKGLEETPWYVKGQVLQLW